MVRLLVGTALATLLGVVTGLRKIDKDAANSTKVEAMASLPYSFYDSVGPFDMSWGFPDAESIEIEFSLPSDFYIGIGLGGHDTVMGWIDVSGNVQVADYWDEGAREPLTDESKGCRNDIIPISGSYSFENWVTTIRFRRKLDTRDKGDCDHVIRKAPMNITYAYCDAPWCMNHRTGCNAFKDGCTDSAHSGGAMNFITVDFSGNR